MVYLNHCCIADSIDLHNARAFHFLRNPSKRLKNIVFVAAFHGCTSTGRVGLCFLWFFVQELPKAQPAVVLVLKRLRRLGNGLTSHPTDLEKPGIEPATPGLQDIGLSPTPRRLKNIFQSGLCFYQKSSRPKNIEFKY